jgi:hypothetical protein
MRSERTRFYVPPPLDLGVYDLIVGNSAGNTNNIDVTIPPKSVPGRSLLIVSCGMDSPSFHAFTFNTPVGWVQYGAEIRAARAGCVWARIIDQNTLDAGFQNFRTSGGQSEPWMWQCLRVEGHNVASPIEGNTGRAFDNNATDFSPNARTPSGPDSMHFYHFCGGSDSASFSTPGSYDELYDRNRGGTGSMCGGVRVMEGGPISQKPASTCSASTARSFLFQMIVKPFTG